MKKYQFTGHLSPLPQGVRLPLQLSGEVYLVSEVDHAWKNREIEHRKELAEVRAASIRIASLNRRRAQRRSSKAKGSTP